jgi:hypothetical protein
MMDPGLYALIKPVAFTVLLNPGAMPVYQNFAPPDDENSSLHFRAEGELFLV